MIIKVWLYDNIKVPFVFYKVDEFNTFAKSYILEIVRVEISDGKNDAVWVKMRDSYEFRIL